MGKHDKWGIPPFQHILRPLLEALQDGESKSLTDLEEAMALHFGLSEEARKVMLPSGVQPVFFNRVGWARTYLKKAGLIHYPHRGGSAIMDDGRLVLKEHPHELTIKDLKERPGWTGFQTKKSKPDADNALSSNPSEETPDETPDEEFERVHEEHKERVKNDIKERLAQCDPMHFERIVVDLLLNLGYGGSRKEAGEAFATTGDGGVDGGVDGVVKDDRLGLDRIYVQAKRWKSQVGRPEIHKFAGALQGKKAKKGVFITTSDFSKKAKDYVVNLESRIILIDGDQLAEHIFNSNTGVVTKGGYEFKEVASDYFEDAA